MFYYFKESQIILWFGRNTNANLQQQISATGLLRKRLKTDEESYLAACQQRSKVVQEAQQENIAKMKELYRFYSTDHLSPVFIHQMGMNQSYQHCDTFIKHLELYMQNNFKVEVNI